MGTIKTNTDKYNEGNIVYASYNEDKNIFEIYEAAPGSQQSVTNNGILFNRPDLQAPLLFTIPESASEDEFVIAMKEAIKLTDDAPVDTELESKSRIMYQNLRYTFITGYDELQCAA